MPTRKNEAKWIEARERWQINVMNEGVRKTFVSSTPGKKGKIECEKKADKWLKERLANENSRAEVILDQWYSALQESTSKSHCLQQRSYINNYIKPVIGKKKIGSVSKRDLQDIINKAYKNGDLAEKTLKNLRSCIMAFMKYCRSIPCTTLFPEDLTIPHGARPSEKSIATAEELKTLFTVDTANYKGKPTEDHFVYAFRLSASTGMRPGEIIGLQWTDIKDGKIILKRSINKYEEITHGKNDNARRTIVMSNIAKQAIEGQRNMLKRKGMISKYVFPDKDGDFIPQRNYLRAWRRYCETNGINQKLTPYEMRHTFVSIMDEMPEGLKKKVIGHSQSMDTEGIYGHLKVGDLERAAALVDAAFENILK